MRSASEVHRRSVENLRRRWRFLFQSPAAKRCGAITARSSAGMGKAKLLNFITDRVEDVTKIDFNTAQSFQDIGRKLLQSIGFKDPDDVSIAAAIELNDTFIDGLQRIRNAAQGPMLEQVDD